MLLERINARSNFTIRATLRGGSDTERGHEPRAANSANRPPKARVAAGTGETSLVRQH
jgi:hypothetical protein